MWKSVIFSLDFHLAIYPFRNLLSIHKIFILYCKNKMFILFAEPKDMVDFGKIQKKKNP